MRVALINATLSVGWPTATAQQVPAAPCRASGALVRISDLPEASGVAISRRSPGVSGRTTIRARLCLSRSTQKDR
jgi:hypothetical protein